MSICWAASAILPWNLHGHDWIFALDEANVIDVLFAPGKQRPRIATVQTPERLA
jgi:hypothetical protein